MQPNNRQCARSRFTADLKAARNPNEPRGLTRACSASASPFRSGYLTRSRSRIPCRANLIGGTIAATISAIFEVVFTTHF